MRVAALIVAALFAAGCTNPTAPAEPEPTHVDGTLSADTLRGLCGVAGVEVLIAVPNPTHRIIHIRDWHHVPRDLYARDIRHAEKRAVSEEEVSRRYAAFLRDVDGVQREQELILDELARSHGIERVLVEGLTPEGVENYRAVVSGFRDTQARLAKAAAAALESQSAEAAAEVERLDSALRQESLPYGATGRLARRGLLVALPLDDASFLEAAAPDGAMKLNPAAVEARHDGQVKRALAAGPWAVLVLGGAHDLSASVRRFGGGTTVYIRVTPKRFAAASGG